MSNAVTRSVDARSGPEALLDRSLWLQAGIIAILVLLAYSSVFTAGFIWDDDAYVTNNRHLESLAGLFKIWFSPGATPQYYPMVFTVFWVEYHLWGLNPTGYHLVNIVLHLLNALLLWHTLRRLQIPAAFWSACIFAVHPVQVETVAWITELKNVLSLSFYLLALLTYLRCSDMAASHELPLLRGRLWYAAAFTLFLLALLSKTVTATLPAVILLLLWWRNGEICRKDAIRLTPFFAVGAAMGLFTARLEVTHVFASGPEWSFSFLERILIAGRAVLFYAGKLLLPWPLVFSYPRWDIDAGQWWQYLFPGAVFILSGGLWHFRSKIGRAPLAAMLFFIGTLFPALGFFNVYPMRYSFVADHFQYVACIGVICLFCSATDRLLGKFRSGREVLEPVFYGGILLVLCLVTWQQGRVYHDRMKLFSDVIDKNPSSWMSYIHRGVEYSKMGRYDQAMADIERALALNPDDADALTNRAVLRQMRGEYEPALADYNRAIALHPRRFDIYRNRGVLYLATKRYDLALKDCTSAITIKADYVDGYLLRAMIYSLLEDYGKALQDLSEALRLDPDNPESLANRGLVYYRMGQTAEAIIDFNRAVTLKPDAAPFYYNRGLALAAMGEREKALADLQLARRMGYPVNDSELEPLLRNGDNR